MPIPQGQARLIIATLLRDLFEHAQRTYGPDMRYSEAVVATLIMAEIIVAEENGKPISEQRLARAMGVSRSRLRPRIVDLTDRGLIHRQRDGLHINGAMFGSARGERSIRQAAEIVIAAGNAMSQTDMSELDS